MGKLLILTKITSAILEFTVLGGFHQRCPEFQVEVVKDFGQYFTLNGQNHQNFLTWVKGDQFSPVVFYDSRLPQKNKFY